MIFAFVFVFLLSFGLAVVNASQVEYIDVDAYHMKSLTMESLNRGDKVSGYISIVGGSDNDIDFRITDPQGGIVIDSGRVYGGSYFYFVADLSGAYTLWFDNSFSTFSTKSVTLSFDVEQQIFGMTPSLFILLVIAISVVIGIVVVILVYFATKSYKQKQTRGNPTISSPQLTKPSPQHETQSTGERNPTERLKNLKEMLDNNVISKEEYERKKSEILSQV